MIFRVLVLLFAVVGTVACAPSTYTVRSPLPSEIPYEGTGSMQIMPLAIRDARDESDRNFSHGTLKAGLILNGSEIEPISYLQEQVERELQARGLEVGATGAHSIVVDVNRLVIKNYRSHGYAPFITFTMLSSDVTVDGSRDRVAVFIKRGKVPVWSFSEVIEPTLSEPLDLLVKEFAAKLSRNLDGARISDMDLERIVSRIRANPDVDNYLDVYQLGFGNNPKAIPILVELSQGDAEYMRLAAISSLGILQAEDQLQHLQSIYRNNRLWQDRGMALKAIGDIGTEEALGFLRTALNELDTEEKREREWSREVIALYLD